ncbi:tic20-like family protein [Lyngbya aestuarii BL J]|uniref:Tic20-like family protein n=1 Tax=Lyngbya aestuarii BL J TaxID=1348334 RepID=U7Q941_9CYAN|nr:DUF4870 domain-containing protein [Lyngbya aestuarii]ERT04303.1 tic20-like family protein [Lyngbya aestuarii BL J]
MNEENKRILLSILCHGSIFFSCSIVSVAIPLAILYIFKDRVVRANAKEALNFHLTVFIWVIIAGIFILSLIMLYIGLTLVPLIGLLGRIMLYIGLILLLLFNLRIFIMPIIGIVAVMNEPSVPYRYPGIFRLIK